MKTLIAIITLTLALNVSLFAQCSGGVCKIKPKATKVEEKKETTKCCIKDGKTCCKSKCSKATCAKKGKCCGSAACAQKGKCADQAKKGCCKSGEAKKGCCGSKAKQTPKKGCGSKCSKSGCGK